MKKLIFFLLPFFVLSGCGNTDTQDIPEESQDTQALLYQKQKDCFDSKNEFMDYIMKKHDLEIVPDLSEKLDKKENISFNILDNSEEIFYSKSADKCIGAYHFTKYSPIIDYGKVIGYSEDGRFYIDDVINDDNLWADSVFEYESDYLTYDDLISMWEEYNEVRRKWKSKIQYYRGDNDDY